MKWASFLLVAGIMSCGIWPSKYSSYPENPYPRIRKIVVLPVVNLSRDRTLNVDEISDIFASEMIKFNGFDVIRPVMVRAAMEKGEVIQSVDDAVKVGRRLQADAIIAIAITDQDPYDPPRTALQVQLLRTRAQRMSANRIDEMIQSASWRIGPYAMSVGKAGFLVDAFQRMWDSHSSNVRSEVQEYSEEMDDRDTAYRDENEILAVQGRWMQFVANQAINLLIERAKRRELNQS